MELGRIEILMLFEAGTNIEMFFFIWGIVKFIPEV